MNRLKFISEKIVKAGAGLGLVFLHQEKQGPGQGSKIKKIFIKWLIKKSNQIRRVKKTMNQVITGKNKKRHGLVYRSTTSHEIWPEIAFQEV